MSSTEAATLDDRRPIRHRQKVLLRQLEVLRMAPLGASMLRVTLTGPELADFASLGFDDHVKMFFAAPGEAWPMLPVAGPNGLEFPENGPRPIARDFTPRRYDPEQNELDIDFALRHVGPARDWAVNARTGDPAWIAGPRGSIIVPFGFDWHLLIADETGLPAVARRLEELPADSRAIVLLEVNDKADEFPIRRPPHTELVWAHRSRHAGLPGAVLLHALRQTHFPDGDYSAWVACESEAAKLLRSILIDERAANRKWVRAHGYWRRGTAAVHDHFDE